MLTFPWAYNGRKLLEDCDSLMQLDDSVDDLCSLNRCHASKTRRVLYSTGKWNPFVQHQRALIYNPARHSLMARVCSVVYCCCYLLCYLFIFL